MSVLEINAMNKYDEQISPKDIPLVKPKGFGERHLQLIFIFLAMAHSFGFRIILSVAIVPMTNNSSNSSFQRMDWDEQKRGIIFSCNFWGIFISTAMAGFVTHKIGAKLPLLISILSMSLLALFTPYIAPMGWIWMCARQVVEGFFGGFIITASNYLLGRWVHPIERTLLAGLTVSGVIVGKISSIILTGYLVSSSLGWPSSYYIPGVIGVFWSILWWIYGSNTPLKNSRISEEELAFLKNIPGLTSDNQTIPWREILTSKPVWSLIICQCCQNWCWILVWVALPTYIYNILHFDIKSSAFVTAMSYTSSLIISMTVSPLSAWLIKNGYTSVATSRKIFNSCGMWIPSILIFSLAFVHDNLALAIFLLLSFNGMNGGVIAGYSINHLDLSPNYSGIISSLFTCCGAIVSIITPLFFGFVVTDVTNPYLWRILFITGSVAFFIGNLNFLILARFTVQPWNDNSQKIKQEPS